MIIEHFIFWISRDANPNLLTFSEYKENVSWLYITYVSSVKQVTNLAG